MRMNMITSGLSVVESNKNRSSSIGGFVVVNLALHKVVDNHAKSDVAVLDLLCGFRVHRFSSLRVDAKVARGRLPRMIVGQIDVEKFRKPSISDHRIEIVYEFESSSLI